MFEENYEAEKYQQGKKSSVKESLVVETALAININNEPFTITMQTPGDEKNLAVGLLYTEGFLKKEIPEIGTFNVKKASINVTLKIPKEQYANKRSLLSVASCGICGKKDLDKIEGERLKSLLQLPSKQIQKMFDEMERHQQTFSKTGGSHAASIFDDKYKMLSIKEDIGRHNAVDKAIGECFLNNNLNKGKILLVSGRVSYEIITKCFRANIPILAAVSAPSSLAVDFSKELGITLLGFCRGDKFTVYSHVGRIIE